MKRIVAMLVIVVCLLGCLTGCHKKPEIQYSKDKIAPPELTVSCGTERVKTLRGSTSWQYLVGENEWDGEEKDDINPLLSKDQLPCLSFTETDEKLILTLEFDIAPIDVFAMRWDTSDFGDVTAEGEDLWVKDGTIELSKTESIYEISARWYTNEGNKLQGMIYYSFYTEKVS